MEHFGEHAEIQAIVEHPPSRALLAWRRAKRIGMTRALGQVLFVTAISPLLRRLSAKRIGELRRELTPDSAANLSGCAVEVESVNSQESIEHIARIAPDVVVVNGTRIIKDYVLNAIRAPVINTHAGITPTYRGVHGAYWALAEGHPELVGTTVHRVDAGIDTGAIVEQVIFQTRPEDNFVTYPYLHLKAGIPALTRAVEAAMSGTLEERPSFSSLSSHLRYHPTAWSYLLRRIKHGVR
jgi:methionyl-tRNA formyltransferase